ncbi:MAG: 5-methylthioadenosine/S-adenosylhomocysteine deaminase [Pseudomonadota bacterium]|nr:5-methylthioadenosine/S-adenosylhomocysteine deaminase [Pseudomonadota bacterium]
MQNIDTLIHGRWVIPVTQGDPVLNHHSIAIHDGRIVEILPTAEAGFRFNAQIENHCISHALIPGLINAHTHAAMSLFRGMADDLPLMDWLSNHIWPAETRWMSEEFVHDGTELAMAEMLRSGTTCFNDMYFFPDTTARLARKAGMRACVGLIVLDFPTIWAGNADEYIEKALQLRDQYRSDALIRTPFAPHAPYTVSDAPLEKLRMLSDEMDLPVHMHVHETAHEVDEAVKKSGLRPLQRLANLGLVSPNLLAVHMTQLNDDDIALLARTGAHVVHCPESNLKLASGYCPVQKLLDAGVNVALGTDGSASNNDLNMLGEMHTAALIGKCVAGNAAAINASQVLRMATLNGARALNLDTVTGSLEKNKFADIVAIDFSALEMQPVYHPVSHLVYSAGREQVTDVWVAGKHLLKDRALTTLDEQKILQKVRTWNEKIAE